MISNVFWLQYFVVHQYYGSSVLCRSIYASVSDLLLLLCAFLCFCLSISVSISVSVCVCLSVSLCLSISLSPCLSVSVSLCLCLSPSLGLCSVISLVSALEPLFSFSLCASVSACVSAVCFCFGCSGAAALCSVSAAVSGSVVVCDHRLSE